MILLPTASPLHKINLIGYFCSQSRFLKIFKNVTFDPERNSHDLLPLSQTARKNAKDSAFNKTITRNKSVSLIQMVIFTQC